MYCRTNGNEFEIGHMLVYYSAIMYVLMCWCSLSKNMIGEVGGKAIGYGLKCNRSLQVLG